ncbi:MAG: tetratricopeptide repeat protein, partial [Candidatus Cloacimonetes bacterium]|nr:tetratricopeptide repeat protein [Candidatus Cloacimonadota bacterium]
FVLSKIGLIYLYAPDVCDLVKAESYFAQAAKHAVGDYNPKALRVANIISEVQRNIQHESVLKAIKTITSETYFNCGVSCYAQGKFKDATRLFSKAYSINPEMQTAGFAYAKALCAYGEDSQAVNVLVKVIDQNRLLAFKAAIDLDLALKPSILFSLINLNDALLSDTLRTANFLRDKMIENSLGKEYLSDIYACLKAGTYFEAKRAEDILESRHEWFIEEAIIDASQKPMVLSGHPGIVADVKFSPDGSLVASCDWKGEIRIWDAKTHTILLSLSGHTGEVYECAFNSSGKLLVSAGENGEVIVWDIENETELTRMKGISAKANSVCFSADNRYIYAGGENRIIFRWDWQQSKQQLFKWNYGDILSMHCSPDNKHLCIGSSDNSIGILNLQTGKFIRITGHTAPVSCVHYNPDGRLIASGSYDRTVRLWDIRTQGVLHVFRGHTDKVLDLDFSPNGNYIASASADNTSRVWGLTGSEIQRLTGHKISVETVCFSPDAQSVATAGYDHKVKLWGQFIESTSQEMSVKEFIPFEAANEERVIAIKDEILQNDLQIQEILRNVELEKARELFQMGLDEEKRQKRKLFFKEKGKAEIYFRQAAILGLPEAKEKLGQIEVETQ